ncbi:MAG: hypothetical protein WCD80_05830 [Desulfobaccales bacterium]
MLPPGEPAAASPSKPLRRALLWVQTLRPEWALALALVLNGALNINSGLRYNLVPFSQIGPLSSLGESLSVLGSSTQAILGAFLVLLGLGVLKRLATAWAFAVLLLAVTVAINLAQGNRGASLIISGAMLLALLVLPAPLHPPDHYRQLRLLLDGHPGHPGLRHLRRLRAGRRVSP